MSQQSDLSQPPEQPRAQMPSLTPEAQTDLSILTHYTLLYCTLLPKLHPEHLLCDQPEMSLATGSGAVFEALTTHIAKHTNKQRHTLRTKLVKLAASERLQLLRELADESASAGAMRELLTGADGRVVGAARLRPGARDGRNVRYVWLHGLDGCCSDRVCVDDGGDCARVVRGEQLLRIADGLDAAGSGGLNRGARADRTAAAWIRERVHRARAREGRVRKEAQKRSRTPARIVMDGVVVDVQACGRGRRERKNVSYGEDSAAEDEDEFTLGDGSGSGSEEDEVSDVESVVSDVEDFVAPARQRLRSGADRALVSKGSRRSLRNLG